MAGGLQPPSEEEERRQSAAKQQGVIFVLENASLEVARVGKVRVLRLSNHTCTLCMMRGHSTQYVFDSAPALLLDMNSKALMTSLPDL